VSTLLAGAYLWIKALHIVGVIAWMAGLLYLPRLFVYHAGAPAFSDRAETFAIMERRLLRGIMNPALVIVVVSGGFLAVTPGVVDWRDGWIWAKLALVAGLILFHMLLARWRREFAAAGVPHGAGFFRRVNEIPTVLLIGVVVLVVVKPF
jgi:putative membrane protein